MWVWVWRRVLVGGVSGLVEGMGWRMCVVVGWGVLVLRLGMGCCGGLIGFEGEEGVRGLTGPTICAA